MSSGRRLAGLAACIALLALLAAPARATTLPAGFEEVVMTSGLTAPTQVTFAPDGRMFVAEKAGRVRVVTAGGTLLPTPLVDISSRVNTYIDRGLLSIVVDSNFATNRYLYLFYVYESDPLNPTGPKTSRVTRVVVNPDNTASPETVILGSVSMAPCPASNTVDCIPADNAVHTVGGLRSDPDGTLWIGSGDATGGEETDPRTLRTYNEQSYAGKLIHVDRLGRGLAGHPFCPADNDLTHVCTKLHAKGFRYPFRVTLRPGRVPLVGDVGWASREELDAAQPGRNYGWPCYEGSIRTPTWSATSDCAAEYAKEGGPDAAVPPIYDYPHDGNYAAIIGGPIYNGTEYPAEYRGDYFLADFARRFIRRLKIDADDRVTSVQTFGTNWVEGPALEAAPNGDLLSVDFGRGDPRAGRVLRIRFAAAGGNRAPVAVASAAPTSGDPPLTVQFDGSGSSDPDGDPLTYRWDFGDTHGDTRRITSHTYTAVGTYTAGLTVSDGRGGSDTEEIAIFVGTSPNEPPVPTITKPTEGSLYRVGQPVELEGSATDPEDGPLGDDALSWHVVLIHGDHTHDYGNFPGSRTSFTPATDHDADAFFEIDLNATDSDGALGTKRVTIRPETVTFTLDSSPTGAPLSYAGTAVTAPFTKQSAIGFQTSISAADQFTRDGTTYRFVRWSDGGARVHDITIPDVATTLVATYEQVGGNSPPAASFTYTPSAPVPGQRVDFTSTSTDPDGTIVLQAWDLDNDGHYQDASGPTASRTFAAAGSYTVRLYVRDNLGASSIATRTVTVASSGNEPPIADFTWTPPFPAPGQRVDFTSTSRDPDGSITLLAWDLDNDGHYQDASGPTASRTFAAAGNYTVRLFARDNAGASSIASKVVQVDGAAQSAAFGAPATTTAARGGTMALPLRCLDLGRACTGTLRLVSIPAGGGGATALVSRRVRLRPGEMRLVRLRRSTALRVALRRAGRVRALAEFRPANGAMAVQSWRSLARGGRSRR